MRAVSVDAAFFIVYGLFVIVANLSTLMASAAAMQEEPTTQEARIILEDSSLRTSCLIGAFLGAMVSVCVRPAKPALAHQQWREIGLRGVASMASAVLVTPMFFRWVGWRPDVDMVVAYSGMIAFFSVTLIMELSPFVINAVTNKVKQILGPIKGGDE